MIRLLTDNPLLLLFVVAGAGYLLGSIRIGGFSLGVAAVLFVGIAVGALDPALQLPELVYQLGLIVFVYTMGLNSGSSFFASFRRQGLRDNSLVLGMLVVAAALTLIASSVLRLKPALAAGMFAGSLTNTPALAGVLEYLKGYAPATALQQVLAEPVVAYSATYPMGVVGILLAITLAQRLWKIDYAAEAQRVRDRYTAAVHRCLHNRTIRVTRPEVTQRPVQDLIREHKWDVVFGRLKRGNSLAVVQGHTQLELGDLVTVVGPTESLDHVAARLGEASAEHVDFNRGELDYRRIFVSNPKVAGHRLRDLHLPQQFGAVVTRLRRGDVEFAPHGDTLLELGDRVRVLTHRQSMEAVTAFLGDSYRAVSEIDILSFSLGLALGLLVSVMPIRLPGGITLKLGLAGGPLVVALILSAAGRTGPLTWSLPYSANLTLRQIGMILFLAGVGTRAGNTFLATFMRGDGLALVVAGAIITTATGLGTLWIGYRGFRIPMGLLIGMLAGLQTQPAVLGFALEQAGTDLPNVGYATVYPVATIAKIVIAQVLLIVLL